jgi:hypothetical protein
MIKRTTLILILALSISSCRNQQKSSIKKLIYFAGQELVYDSLNNPHLSIRKYFEYSQNENIRIATGHRYYDSIAPMFGLDKYYEIPTSGTIKQIINNTFLNKSFDSTYYGDESRWYYFFIYETPDNKIKTIRFIKDALPEDLKSIHSFLDSLINSTEITKSQIFSVDILVNDLETELFRHHPPVPRPIPDSLNMIKYTEPKK